MNASKIQSLIAVILGGGLIVFGLLQQRKRKKLLADGIEAEGVIFDVVADKSGDGAGYPVIRFVTKDQQWVTEKYKLSMPLKKKGEKVTVIYNAGNPKEFVLKKI